MSTCSTESRAKISRRDFLAIGAAATAALGLSSCSNSLDLASTNTSEEGQEYLSDEKWVPVACWVDCGGRCPLIAQVKDGVITRIKGDTSHEDSLEYPQQRACPRGRAQRHHILAADRLKYPMKRKHWLPEGKGDNSLRGKDEWERISWDEATQLIADELARVYRDYGPNAVLNTDSMRTEPMNLLYKLGGCCVSYMTASYGSWQNGAYDIGTGYDCTESCLDRFELMKADTIIMWGINPAWSSPGTPVNVLRACRDNGCKVIAIDPFYNDSALLADADWVPVRPGTDMALMFGVISALLEGDAAGKPMIDWDFVHKYSVGFDAESMPEHKTVDENLKDYVLGKYDNVAKTPEWASEICGVAPERIRQLAEELDPAKNVALITSYAPGRTFDTDNLPQLFMALGVLTGHIGRSGNMTGIGGFWNGWNGGPALVQSGTTYNDLFTSHSGVFNDPRQGSPIPYDEIVVVEDKQLYKNTIPNKKTIDCGECLFNEVTEAREKDTDIKIIWGAFCNIINCYPDPNLGIKGLREGDVDLVIRQDINFTPTAQYADIVLPATTPWERDGGGQDEYFYHNKEALFFYFKVMEPLFETKDDQWIVREIGKKMGFADTDIFPVSRSEQEFVHLANARLVAPDGTESPLVTITQEDIDGWDLSGLRAYLETAETVTHEGGAGGTEGIDTSVQPFVIEPQEGVVTIDEIRKTGCYQAKRSADDDYRYIPFEDFVKDPEANPMHTESGKIELYSQVLADKINGMGYSEIKPYPTYIAPLQGYEATFSNWEKKEKGEYPYQVINPHYLGRQHSVMNTVDWLREAYQHPVFIPASDAEAEGIADGDTVLLTSAFGKTIRRACVTQRLIPGVLALPHGAWLDMDEETGIDRGGHDNVLVSSASRGQSVDAYNSTMVRIEKYTGEALPAHEHEPVPIAPVE